MRCEHTERERERERDQECDVNRDAVSAFTSVKHFPCEATMRSILLLFSLLSLRAAAASFYTLELMESPTLVISYIVMIE